MKSVKNMEITCPQKLFVAFFKACCLKYSRVTKPFQEKHGACKSPSASRGFSSHTAGFLTPSLQPWNKSLTRILAGLQKVMSLKLFLVDYRHVAQRKVTHSPL